MTSGSTDCGGFDSDRGRDLDLDFNSSPDLDLDLDRDLDRVMSVCRFDVGDMDFDLDLDSWCIEEDFWRAMVDSCDDVSFQGK